jgi:hypothetical protein
VSEDLEEAKPTAAAAQRKPGRLHRGKTQEPQRESMIGRLPILEHAADPSTKITRGGIAGNGMWGARGGDTLLTRAQ